MNRDIKFRGKRVDTGEWVYGGLVVTEESIQCGESGIFSNCYIIEFPKQLSIDAFSHGNAFWTHNEFIQVDPATIGQYTGLKDKNGVEIYEGDIVNMHYFFENFDRETLGAFEDEAEVVGVVRIDEMSVYTDCKKERFAWACYLQDPAEELEVIGNFYDNPELLEGGQG